MWAGSIEECAYCHAAPPRWTGQYSRVCRLPYGRGSVTCRNRHMCFRAATLRDRLLSGLITDPVQPCAECGHWRNTRRSLVPWASTAYHPCFQVLNNIHSDKGKRFKTFHRNGLSSTRRILIMSLLHLLS